MMCSNCVQQVQEALTAVAGVSNVQVNLSSGTAVVCSDTVDLQVTPLVSAILKTAGKSSREIPHTKAMEFSREARTNPPVETPSPRVRTKSKSAVESLAKKRNKDTAEDREKGAEFAEAVLLVTGMTCSSCTARVEAALQDLTGVKDVTVNLLVNKATVTYDSGSVEVAGLLDAVKEIGFGCELLSDSGPDLAAKAAAPVQCVLGVRGMTCSSCTGRV
eukprot:SAG31_NODE_17920_length_653_cov_1.207581_1_plen_217_part_11